MATSPQMYDNGLENLKRAALSAKVRSFLNGGGELDPADLENAELSLDLQSLIEDPNFEVGEGLFPELIHDKVSGGGGVKGGIPVEYSQLAAVRSHPGSQNGHFPRNPLAYMPQPVHQGSTFTGGNNNNNANGGANSNNSQQNNSSNGGGAASANSPDNHQNVKEEPHDHHRLDFNANAVTSSGDPSNVYGGPYSSNSLSSVTSPSSTSSTSSGGGGGSGGGGSGYSPNAYNIHHHLTPATIPSGAGGDHPNGLIVKNGNLTFNGKALHPAHHGGHHHGHHPHSNGHHGHHGVHHGASSSSSSSSHKKLKNVDKASDEYKRRRERNNIAVRKSREKAKMRTRETEERVKLLSKENERLQKKIDLLTEELTFLRSFFSNVGGLPEQIHREFNKHLETFQHHHVQNGIHLQ